MGVKTRDWRCGGCGPSEEVLDQRPIQFQDEGVDLGGAGTVKIVNFVGAAVEAVRSNNTLTITITGGGGSSAITDYEDFLTDGFPAGANIGDQYRLVFNDPDLSVTIDNVEYYHNTIIYKHTATEWLSWSANFGADS